MKRKKKTIDIIVSPETAGVVYTYKMDVGFSVRYGDTIKHYSNTNYYQTEKKARQVVNRYFDVYTAALEAGKLAGFRRLGFHRIPLNELKTD